MLIIAILKLEWFDILMILGCVLVSLKMTQHHVGALVVVRPGSGEQKSISGIITERGVFCHFCINTDFLEREDEVYADLMVFYGTVFCRLPEENHCSRKVI